MKNHPTIHPVIREHCNIENYYYSDSDYVEFGIPKNGQSIGMFISGGVDSALTCYLIVKAIQKFGTNNKIYPITTEFMARPFNIKHSWQVLREIENLTEFKFSQHLIFPMPNHVLKITDEMKKPIMSENIDLYFKHYNLFTLFNGLTANPPIEEVPDNFWGERQIERDNIDLVLLKLKQRSCQYPFLFSDKRVIAELYDRHNIVSSIFPLTRSCESEMEESKYFTKTCFEVREPGQECWWCRERQYGFKHLVSQDFINTKNAK